MATELYTEREIRSVRQRTKEYRP